MSKTGLQATNHRNKLAQWSNRIAECRSSGMTVTQWCEQHGIPKSTYYTWQRKVYNVVATGNAFVEVQVEAEHDRAAGATIATVTVGGIRAEIHTGTDEATMTALLRAMKLC